MPYLSEKIKIANTEYDRRVKLTEDQKDEIRKIYASGVCGTRPLAKQFNVSRSLIQTIVNPNIAESKKQYIKDNWKKYQKYGKERAEIVREYRRHKQNLYLEGKI